MIISNFIIDIFIIVLERAQNLYTIQKRERRPKEILHEHLCDSEKEAK